MRTIFIDCNQQLAPVFTSRRMREIDELVKRVAPSDANVLITGESGVGKEVVANQIHRLSKRADGPLVKLNCAAFPQKAFVYQILLVFPGRFRQFLHTGAVTGNGFHHRRHPTILPHCERLQCTNLFFHALAAFMIALIDNEDIGNLHQSGLHALNVVAQARHKNHDDTIRQPHDIDFVLPDADGLDQHLLLTRSIQQQRHLGSRARQATEETSRRHRANKHP